MWHKVEDTRTLLTESFRPKETYGISIDVFPIDGFLSTKVLQSLQLYIYGKLNSLYSFTHTQKIKSFSITQIIAFLITKFIGPGRIAALIKRYMRLVPFNKAKYAGAVSGIYGKKEVYKSSVFKRYTQLEFNNKMFMCISDYDIYLKQHYGDYMKIPKEEDRITHQVKPWWKEITE